MRLKELTPALRAAVWELVLTSIEGDSHHREYSGRYLDGRWARILKDRQVDRLHLPIDELSLKFDVVSATIKQLIWDGDYVQVFGFLEYVIRHPASPNQFSEHVVRVLKSVRAAYTIVDKTVVPIGSEAEQSSLRNAFSDLASSEFHGARKHLHLAAEYLSAGKLSDSIRESIHAVEFVVRVLEPQGDFSKALAKLDAKIAIHGAMKAGFGSLYGYTSDEKGIRHPLLDGRRQMSTKPTPCS